MWTYEPTRCKVCPDCNMKGISFRSTMFLLSLIFPLCFPELWNDGLQSRKNKKKDPFCPVKKKKPVVVSDILFPLSYPCLIPLIIHPHHIWLQPLNDVLFKTNVSCHRTFFLNRSITALYRLHAARSWYSRRLDRNKKGILETGIALTCVCVAILDLLVVSVSSPHRRWHHWGHTGWRWTVRVCPRPWFQSISVWVQRSTNSYTGTGLIQYFQLKALTLIAEKETNVTSSSVFVMPFFFFTFCAVYLLNLRCPCLTTSLPFSPF